MENLNDGLGEYTGTEGYHKTILPGYVLTDGAKAAADKFKAYWLIDVILSYQPELKKELFQIWTIRCTQKGSKRKAVVIMRPDADKPAMVTQRIGFTDFPEGLFTLWLIDDQSAKNMGKVILLPSEY